MLKYKYSRVLKSKIITKIFSAHPASNFNSQIRGLVEVFILFYIAIHVMNANLTLSQTNYFM